MNTPGPHLSLHDWSCLRTELVWIYDHAPSPQARRGVFDHREGNWAWYLRKGGVRVTTKAGVLTARAGQWVFPPAEIHRHEFSDDAELISVRFFCQWPSGENLLAPHPGLVLDGADYPALVKTARALERLVARHLPGTHYDHARQASEYPGFIRFQRAFLDWIEAWFEASLAAGASSSRHAGDDRALRAARALDAAPLDKAFPRGLVPKTAGVGAVQLGRIFRKQFNLSPLQYWERRRLEFARLCLETGEPPIKALAASLGFRSDSHFTVWFKRRTGVSPGRYRASHLRA